MSFIDYPLTSDGKAATYSVENSNDEHLLFNARYKAVLPSYTHLIIKFPANSADTYIKQLAFKDSFGDFGDPDYECKTKFVIMTEDTPIGSKGEKDKRGFVVLPELQGKHRLFFYSHGYMGSWVLPNRGGLGHFFDKMADRDTLLLA